MRATSPVRLTIALAAVVLAAFSSGFVAGLELAHQPLPKPVFYFQQPPQQPAQPPPSPI